MLHIDDGYNDGDDPDDEMGDSLGDDIRPVKDCVFLHGLLPLSDRVTDFIGDTTSTDPMYWGDVHKNTPQCRTRVFVHEDTVRHGWSDRSLQKAYCNHVTRGDPGRYYIRDKIIFAHSMANLILGGAMNNGLCKMHPSSSWHVIGAPLRGSKSADYILPSSVEEVYLKVNPEQEPPAAAGGIVPGMTMFGKPATKLGIWGQIDSAINGAVNATIHKLLMSNEPGWVAMRSMKTSNKDLAVIGEVVRRHANGSMCGISSQGLDSPFTRVFNAWSHLIFQEPNDGLVELASCAVSDVEYGLSYTDAFYAPRVNHVDLTCVNGDDSNNRVDRMPCSWFRLRT